jgi:probable HAF family extracellular repeat protein
MIDVGSLGGTDVEPTSLNENDEIVGFSTLAGDAKSHPFLWSRGHLKDLGTLGGNNGTTNWINDRGEIVGKADLAGPAPQDHDAVLWRDGRMIDLGTLPGDSCSNAYFVNMLGQVVGTSENRDLCHMGVGEHAFLWQNGRMIDLNTVIPPGADLQLTYSVAINDRGEIAGFGVPAGCDPKDYEICGHAYVLLPCDKEDECLNVVNGARNINSAGGSSPENTPPASTTAPVVTPQRVEDIFRKGNHYPWRRDHSD